MTAAFEAALQRGRVHPKTHGLLRNAKTFPSAVEIGVKDPVKTSLPGQSFWIFAKISVVEKPLMYGRSHTFPP